MLEFSGLACKTHIVHIADTARSPGSVEVQWVGVWDDTGPPNGFPFFRQTRWRTPAATFRICFSMVRPTGPGGVSDFFFNSRRTAPAKSARCPQRPASPAPRGPARRPAVSPQPHSAHLPSCAARVFCLSAAPGTSRFAFSSFKKISCAKPARHWLSASHHHLRSTSCSSGSSRILAPHSASARSTAPGC